MRLQTMRYVGEGNIPTPTEFLKCPITGILVTWQDNPYVFGYYHVISTPPVIPQENNDARIRRPCANKQHP